MPETNITPVEVDTDAYSHRRVEQETNGAVQTTEGSPFQEVQQKLLSAEMGSHALTANTGEIPVGVDVTKLIGHPNNMADAAAASFSAELRAREQERAVADAARLSKPVEGLITPDQVPGVDNHVDTMQRVADGLASLSDAKEQ